MRWKSIGTAGAAIAAAAGLGIGGAALATAKEEPTAAVTDSGPSGSGGEAPDSGIAPSGAPSAPADVAGGDCTPPGQSGQSPGAGPR